MVAYITRQALCLLSDEAVHVQPVIAPVGVWPELEAPIRYVGPQPVPQGVRQVVAVPPVREQVHRGKVEAVGVKLLPRAQLPTGLICVDQHIARLAPQRLQLLLA
ncbi:hypothetical protein GCM10028895_11900 [Pontibacter rugosus]